GTDSVGLARFSVSGDGALAYRTGESGVRFLWKDRSGRELESAGDSGEYGNPALSPRGDRLAFDFRDPRSGKNDIWVRDLARGVNSRFTFGEGQAIAAVWFPDASRIIYSVRRTDTYDLFEKEATGEGQEKELLKSEDWKIACDVSRDARFLAYVDRGKDTGW